MSISVGGMVRLRKSAFDERVLKYVRESLTVEIRVPSGYGKKGNRDKGKDENETMALYREGPLFMEVPRSWWFQQVTKAYEYENHMTLGRDMGVRETRLRFEGPYEEQRHAIDLFVSRFKKSWERWKNGVSTRKGAATGLGGLLKASVGFGKTNTAIQVAVELGRVTLIVVHKEFLLKQWVDRIQSVVPGARVGVVQGDRCEFEEVDFIVAMAQSLARHAQTGDRYPGELFETPGLLIVDEVHRIGARTWAPIPGMFPAAFRLGLTATPRRKDGADKVFWYHVGEIVYSAKTETPLPGVRVIQLRHNRVPKHVRKSTSNGLIVNYIAGHEKRDAIVISEVRKAIESDNKRKVMILSERLDHLRRLEHEILHRIPGVTVGKYVGQWFAGDNDSDEIGAIYRSMRRRKDDNGNRLAFKKKSGLADERFVVVDGIEDKNIDGLSEVVDGVKCIAIDRLHKKDIRKVASVLGIDLDKRGPKMRNLSEDELKEAASCQVVLATYQMVQEGVDIPALDTLVLATPISDVEQAIGRIRRVCLPDEEKCNTMCPWRAGKCDGKPSPVVVDVVDLGIGLAEKRFSWRMSYYDNSGIKCSIRRPR